MSERERERERSERAKIELMYVVKVLYNTKIYEIRYLKKTIRAARILVIFNFRGKAATPSRINCRCYEMKFESLWSTYRNRLYHDCNENLYLFGSPEQLNSCGTIFVFHEWIYHSCSLSQYQCAHITQYSIWIQYKYKALFLYKPL